MRTLAFSVVLSWAVVVGAKPLALVDLRNTGEFNALEEMYKRALPDITRSLAGFTPHANEAANILFHWFIDWRNLPLNRDLSPADVYLHGIRHAFTHSLAASLKEDERLSANAAAMLYFLKWQWTTILANAPSSALLLEVLVQLDKTGVTPWRPFWAEGFRHLAKSADGRAFTTGVLRGQFYDERDIAAVCLNYFDRLGAKAFANASDIENLLGDLERQQGVNGARVLELMLETLGIEEQSENSVRAWSAYLNIARSPVASRFLLKRVQGLETTLRIRLLLVLNKHPDLKLPPQERDLLNDTQQKVKGGWRPQYLLEVQRAGCAAKVLAIVRQAP